MASTTQRFRRQLETTTSSAAGPYGYTISLGGSIALTSGHLGTPHLLGALALMLGAVAAFGLLEGAARGAMAEDEEVPRDKPSPVWGNVHVLSAGGALCAVDGVVHVLGGDAAWAAAGFTATFVFFVLTTVQRLWARRLTRSTYAD